MHCSACSTQNRLNARFCRTCGDDLLATVTVVVEAVTAPNQAVASLNCEPSEVAPASGRSQVPDQAHCRKCDLSFRKTDRFCTECGGKLVRPEPIEICSLRCHLCLATLSLRHKFCPCCGNSISATNAMTAVRELFVSEMNSEMNSDELPTFQA
jgi:rRNA maturation endonuclease Nob1